MEYGWVVCVVLIVIVVGIVICFSKSKEGYDYRDYDRVPVQPLPVVSYDCVDVEQICDYPCDNYKIHIPENVGYYGGECHGLDMRQQVGLGFGVGPGIYGSGRWTSEMKGN